MRKQVLFLLLIISTLTYGQSEQTLSKTLYFDFDKSDIRPTDKEALLEVVQFVEGDYSIYIGGHTDNYGSDVYNEALSRRRVDAVVNFLVNKGLSSQHFELDPAGEKYPVTGNETSENRQYNRRVVIMATKRNLVPQIVHNPIDKTQKTTPKSQLKITNKPIKQKPVLKTRKHTSKSPRKISAFNYIIPKDNVFHFYCHEDTILRGKGGTKIYVKANSFAMDCEEGDLIRLELEESLDKADMLKRNLYTVTTDGQVLESVGMIYLMAYHQTTNQKLPLNEGETIRFKVPTYTGQKEVSIYNGIKTLNGVQWKKSDFADEFDIKSGIGKTNIMGWINFDFPCSTGKDYELVIKFKGKNKRQTRFKAKLHLKDRNVILPATVRGRGFKFNEGAEVTVLIWEEDEEEGFKSYAENNFKIVKPKFLQRLFKGKKVFLKYESNPKVEELMGKR